MILETTELTTDNPQWLGAWWLGVLIVGGALILTTFPMMAFPKVLRKQCKHKNQSLSPKKFNHNISDGELLKCNGNMNGSSLENHNCHLCQQSTYYTNRNEDMTKPSIRGLCLEMLFSFLFFFTIKL